MVVDALSKKEVMAYVTTLSKIISDFNEKIKQVAKLDTDYDILRQ